METKLQYATLGKFIEEVDERNYDLSICCSQGISNLKFFQDPKQVAENSKSDKIVRHGYFAYNRATTRNGEKISIAYREGCDCTVSSAYGVFRIKDESVLNPYYLWIYFQRAEFDRYARYKSKGSAHEFFDFDEMCRVIIPLPSIEEQEKVVSVWQGLRDMQQQNTALAKPLLQLCQSYIQECKHKYPIVQLGEYIEECNERNGTNNLKEVRGVSTEKEFRIPQARVDFDKLENYKIVYKDQFVFVPTTDTWRCLAICLSRDNEPFVVSPIYTVFRIIDSDTIMPEYLHLYFKRKEVDRYARFHSWGSARENFLYSDMKRVQIPLPPIEVQQAIVYLYRCAQECQALAKEAAEQAKNICPALIQQVIKGNDIRVAQSYVSNDSPEGAT